MAKTGESYTSARREVIKAHKAKQRHRALSEAYSRSASDQIIDISAMTEQLRRAMAANANIMTEPLRRAMANT